MASLDERWREALRPGPGHALTPAERRTLALAAETFLAGTSLGLTGHDVALNVDGFLRRGRSHAVWKCRLLLVAVELAPLALHGRRFGALDAAERRAFFAERLEPGDHVWGLLGRIRYLILIGAYGDPRAAAAVGFVDHADRKRAVPGA